MDKQTLIDSLSLVEHMEGGYFVETYRSTDTLPTEREGEVRDMCTSIFYMLTDDRPTGYFHKNLSDIVHYFHSGSSLTYYLIDEAGTLTTQVLGPNVHLGEKMQLIVPGNVWKATKLNDGEYGLLGEAVAPGFDFLDNTMATQADMQQRYPQLWDKIAELVLP